MTHSDVANMHRLRSELAPHVVAPDVTILRRAAGTWLMQEPHGLVASIDPAITDSLRHEGVARELVRRIQRMRTEMIPADTVRITLWSGGPAGDRTQATRV